MLFPSPDVPNARLMDLMARTSLSGKLRTRKDGAAEVQIRNTGGHPAFLAEVCVGQEALGQYIPDDNFFWLAPGEKRVVLIEKSPAAKVRLKKDAIRLRAWNAPPVSIE